MELKQYGIILTDLNPSVGSEINKTRPCVIISPDEMNRHLNTLVIAPMTTSFKNYPTRIKTQFDQKTGWIILDQIRTIDKRRIIKILGELTQKEIFSVKSVLKATYVD